MLRPSQTWTSLALLGSSVVWAQARCLVRADVADAGVVWAQARCLVRADVADAGVVWAQARCLVWADVADAGVVWAEPDLSINLVDRGARHHSPSDNLVEMSAATERGKPARAGASRHGSTARGRCA